MPIERSELTKKLVVTSTEGPSSGAPAVQSPRVGGNYFPKVREAREALRARAVELLEKYIKIIDQAAAAGDFETADKALRFLLDHIPAEEGERVLDPSVDKPTEGRSMGGGPQVQIGLVIGGLEPKQLLPQAEVITIEPVSKDPTSNS